MSKSTTEVYHLILKIMTKLKKLVNAFLKADISPSSHISTGCQTTLIFLTCLSQNVAQREISADCLQ